tara:strand:- start:718 stop:867 length:150 start_codon:yes stop_codon:yes gene_type:complete
MAKIEKEIPNPGTGGTYVFDPKTGKSTLIPETETPTENGTTNEEDLASS